MNSRNKLWLFILACFMLSACAEVIAPMVIEVSNLTKIAISKKDMKHQVKSIIDSKERKNEIERVLVRVYHNGTYNRKMVNVHVTLRKKSLGCGNHIPVENADDVRRVIHEQVNDYYKDLLGSS